MAQNLKTYPSNHKKSLQKYVIQLLQNTKKQ